MSGDWSLLTNHGKVLVALARHPDLREWEIADEVGITDRAVRTLVADLVGAGYVERFRIGRRNHYLVRGDRPLRRPVGSERLVGDLLHSMAPDLHPASPQERPLAVVLACTDRRFQEPLRDLLAAERLLGAVEIVLWPGGGAALSGADSRRILRLMQRAAGVGGPQRVLLVAHEGCRARGVRPSGSDPTKGTRDVLARRRQAVDRIRRAFATEPEAWFLTPRTAYRAKSQGAFEAPQRRLAGASR